MPRTIVSFLLRISAPLHNVRNWALTMSSRDRRQHFWNQPYSTSPPRSASRPSSPSLSSQLIENEPQLRALCARIKKGSVIGFDTESDAPHSYIPRLCVVQLSVDGQQFLVDTIAIPRDGLRCLWDVVQDKDIVKVVHASYFDCQLLAYEHDIRITSLFDTSIAGDFLGVTTAGLARALSTFLNIDSVKVRAVQKSNWRLRPLSHKQIEYAIADVAHLPALYTEQMSRLRSLRRAEWVEEECRHMAMQPVADMNPASRKLKGISELSEQGRVIVSVLRNWREGVAGAKNIPAEYICKASLLIEFARFIEASIEHVSNKRLMETMLLDERARLSLDRLPTSVCWDAVDAAIQHNGNRSQVLYSSNSHSSAQSSSPSLSNTLHSTGSHTSPSPRRNHINTIDLTEDDSTAQRVVPMGTRELRNLEALKTWRAQTSEQLGIARNLVFPEHALVSIARANSLSEAKTAFDLVMRERLLKDGSQNPHWNREMTHGMWFGVRDWQRRLYYDNVLSVMLF